MAGTTSSPEVTLEFLLEALGSAVVALRVAPTGTRVSIRSVALLDADDLLAAPRGVAIADLCVLAGVSADAALSWIEQLALDPPSLRPAMLVIKDATTELCRSAATLGIAVGALHAQARADMVLSTLRSVVGAAAGRVAGGDAADGDAAVEESDLYGLAQRVAAMTGGLVSIEDDQSRLLAYSATDGGADELRMLSILGREGPAEHLRRLRELGVFDQLRRGAAVIEVAADESRGWRRRLVVDIRPLGVAPRHRAGSSLGTIWVQEGSRPLEPDSAAVLEGAAAIAARLIHRARSAPTQEAMQIQRLLGLRGGGVDVPSLASALALSTEGPVAVIGVAVAGVHGPAAAVSDLAVPLRLLAGAYARESLVTSSGDRLYVLIPSSRLARLDTWMDRVLDRLTDRFGSPLRAAIAATVPGLEDVPAARAEVDRVLDRPIGQERVTTLTQSRTPVLLGEIGDLVRSREELRDPRLQALVDYDLARATSLVATTEHYLRRFGDVRTAAEELHIHPNTLRYRVRRAEEILGMSLDDPDNRLLLQIQLLVRAGLSR